MDVNALLETVGTWGVPLVVGLSSYLFGRRKNSADTKKTEAETEKIDIERRLEEVELFERINKALETQNEKLETQIRQLSLRIQELEIIVDRQNNERCLGDSCPTKMAYNKIMVSRAKRKKKTPAVTVVEVV